MDELNPYTHRLCKKFVVALEEVCEDLFACLEAACEALLSDILTLYSSTAIPMIVKVNIGVTVLVIAVFSLLFVFWKRSGSQE